MDIAPQFLRLTILVATSLLPLVSFSSPLSLPVDELPPVTGISPLDEAIQSSSGGGEDLTALTTDNISPTEATQRLIERFTSQQLLVTEGSHDFGSEACSIEFQKQLSGQFRATELSYNFEEALSGYSLSPQQLEKIKERCLTESEQSLVRVVEPDDNLACNISMRKLLNNNLVFILPGKDYILPEGVSFDDFDQNITFCGVADLISENSGVPYFMELDSQASGEENYPLTQEEYLVNGKAIDIPPRENLTRLKFLPVDGNRNSVVRASIFTGKLSFLGLNIDATDVNTGYTVFYIYSGIAKKRGAYTFKLEKSYVKNGMKKFTFLTIGMKVDISNSVIESHALYTIFYAFYNRAISIKNSAIINTGDNHNTPEGTIAVHIQDNSQYIAAHRIENIKILGFGGTVHGVKNDVHPRRRSNKGLLIKDVEFSTGVTVPFEIIGDVVIAQGSSGNTWAEPSGEIAATGCKGLLYRGFIEFQEGILCDSAMSAMSAMPTTVPTRVPVAATEYAVSSPQTFQDLITAAPSMSNFTEPSSNEVSPGNSASQFQAGYNLLLLPLFMSLYFMSLY